MFVMKQMSLSRFTNAFEFIQFTQCLAFQSLLWCLYLVAFCSHAELAGCCCLVSTL